MPRFMHVDLEEAAENASDPHPADTTYPFGSTGLHPAAAGQPSGAGRASPGTAGAAAGAAGGAAAGRPVGSAATEGSGAAPEHKKTSRGSGDPGTRPRHTVAAMKYSSGKIPRGIRRLGNPNPPLCKGLRGKKWIKRFFRLGSNSLSAGTWNSYTSAWHKFQVFCQARGAAPDWPLKGKTLNSFVLWCADEQNLALATIKAYVTGLKTLGVLLGGNRVVKGWDLTKFLLRGLANRGRRRPRQSKGSDPCCFEVLAEIKKQLARKHWSRSSKQCIWACCCVGYFGSLRGGELLAKLESGYDKYTDFIWSNLAALDGGGKTIHVPMPKNGEPGGEWVPLFEFPVKKFCPVKALSKLKRIQKKEKIYNSKMPVFRFGSGKNLTKQVLNKVLGELLKPTRFGRKRITSRSFRSGIPTDLERHPWLARDKHVKDWGRWHSSAYKRYMRDGAAQKRLCGKNL